MNVQDTKLKELSQAPSFEEAQAITKETFAGLTGCEEFEVLKMKARDNAKRT